MRGRGVYTSDAKGFSVSLWNVIIAFFIRKLACRMPVASANDPEGTSKKSPLDHYLENLEKGLPEYSVTVAMICAAPLPERRERLFILGSRSKDFSAKDWAAMVEHLQSIAIGLPKHHVRTFLDLGAPAAAQEKPEVEPNSLEWMAEYSGHFSTCLGNISGKGGMAELTDADVKEAGSRISDRYPHVLKKTPWLAATADVNEILVDALCQKAGCHTEPRLADLSQSCGRGSVSVHGTLGTLTTSMRLFSYDHGQFVQAEKHMKILGWDSKSVKLATECLSSAEIYEAAGNGMSWAAVLKVLLPLLKHLGFQIK